MSPGGAMVRRLLLTAFLAALAVALPAAAEEDPAFGLPPGSGPDCLAPDPLCSPAGACDGWLASCLSDGQSASASAGSVEGTSTCRVWDLNMPDPNQSIWETLTIDPEGCIRSFIRRTLDELPPAIATPYTHILWQ